MIDASNIIDCVLYNRYYKFRAIDKTLWMVYESLSEEGPDVKKKLTQFSKESEANNFMAEMRELLRAFLTKSLNITNAVIDEKLKCHLQVMF